MGNKVVSDLLLLTRHLADLMESKGFPSDWTYLFSTVFHDTMKIITRLKLHEKGSSLSNEMITRFCSDKYHPRGGLYAVIAYATAAFILNTEEDTKRAMELLKNIEDIAVTTIDNGPFTSDRSLVAMIVYDALGGEEGLSPTVALATAMNMNKSDKDMTVMVTLYAQALSKKRSPEILMDDFKNVGILITRDTLDAITNEPFDLSIMWDTSLIRPFFVN